MFVSFRSGHSVVFQSPPPNVALAESNTMADTAISTGAQYDSNLRRRNPTDAGPQHASPAYTAADDQKKSKPQVRSGRPLN